MLKCLDNVYKCYIFTLSNNNNIKIYSNMKLSQLTIEMKKVTAQIMALQSKLNSGKTENEVAKIKTEIADLKSLLAAYLKEHLRS